MLSSSSQSSQVTGVRKEKKTPIKYDFKTFPIILAINHSISTLQYYHIPYLMYSQDFLFYLLIPNSPVGATRSENVGEKNIMFISQNC